MLAVFERIDPGVLERILQAAVADDIAFVRYRNQIADVRGSVPDASISANFRYLFEVKTEAGVPERDLRDQVERHLAGLDGSHADERLFLITPDGGPPAFVSDHPQVSWVGFVDLDVALDAVLKDVDDPLPEQSGFLLRELRRLFEADGLLDHRDTVIVAARKAYPTYLKASAYVCRPGRPFRSGLRYLGFYADSEIKPELPTILARHEDVMFSEEHAAQLREAGEEALAAVIETYLDTEPDRRDREWMVLLLTGSDDQGTTRLAHALRNTTRVNDRAWAWTLGQRYARSDLLTRGFTTSSELDEAQAEHSRPAARA